MRKLLQATLLAAIAALFLTSTTPGRAFAQNVACYMDQGGAGFHLGSGCTQTVESGGVLNVASGGIVKSAAAGGAQFTDLVIGSSAAGGALTDRFFSKEVTGVVDNTFTDIVTVSVPNAEHSATIPIVIHARLGTGGAIGAGECVATAYGQVVVARTAGVNAVATATTIADNGSACVAGATTATVSYQVSAISGAVGAINTFTIQVKLARGGGSSTNHKVDVQLDVLNANGSGITVS